MSALQEAARNHYRQALLDGDTITPDQLADMFGQTITWARSCINDIHDRPVSGHDVEIITHEPEPVSDRVVDEPATVRPVATPIADDTAAVKERRGSYLIAWIALVTGISVSIAGNVMHAQATSATVAAWLVAAFWPIALLLSVEVITRVQWPTGTWYAIARYGGTGIVGLVAAIVSYRHMSGLLAHWGEDFISSHLGPLAIDGLVVVATTALMAINKHR